MGFLIIIIVILIAYLIYKENKLHEDLINNLNDELFDQIEIYEKLYENYSKMELLYLFYNKSNLFVERWKKTVSEYNSLNPEKKIKFESVDLFGNEHFVEFDTQADLLIAQQYGIKEIACFRAICNRLLKIKNIKESDETIYKGIKVTYDDIPYEDREDCVLCTEQRLNTLITNDNINIDIYNLFKHLNNLELNTIDLEIYKTNNIFENYPGLSTYFFNYILVNFDKFKKEQKIYDILSKLIYSETLKIEEMDWDSFIKVSCFNLKQFKFILDEFYDNYFDDDNFFLIETIWTTKYSCLNLFKHFYKKGYFKDYTLRWRDLFSLCLNNRYDELVFVLKNLNTNYDFSNSKINLNKNTYNEFDYSADVYFNDKGEMEYKVPMITVNFFEAVELNKNIDKKIKELIKKHFKPKLNLNK